MRNTPAPINKKNSGISTKALVAKTERTLQHLAFDFSSQANIIFTAGTGKIVAANGAACTLLGYDEKELLTKSRSDIFDVNESGFKKVLKQGNAGGKSAALVNIRMKSGDQLTSEITSAVFTEEGIEKSITTITDMSESILKQKDIDTKKEKIIANNIVLAKLKQKRIDSKKEKLIAHNIITARATSDERLAENNQWIKYIAKTSYDVMWDWDIVTGEIYVGDSVEEVFGYKVQNNTVTFSDFSKCLIPEEKDAVQKKLHEMLSSESKSWKDSYSFKRHDDSIAFTTSRASIVRDENRKAIRLIGATQDVSRLQDLENKLENQISLKEQDREKFMLSAKLSSEVIWDWKMLTNEIFIGECFEELFGYSIQNNIGNVKDWGSHLHPDDKEAVKQGLKKAVESSAVRWQHVYRFMRADGSIAKVLDRASIFRHKDGKAYRMIGVMQDISPLKENNTAVNSTDNNKSVLLEKIKSIIVDLVYYSEDQIQTNFSEHLSRQLQHDYTYLANLFSAVEGVTIQTFIIAQKIKRVKELILTDKLNLTEIAWKLHYSSVGHLSNQFKKVTGFSPSYYKQQKLKQLPAH